VCGMCVGHSVTETGFSSCSSVLGAMEILWFDKVEVTSFQTVYIWSTLLLCYFCLG